MLSVFVCNNPYRVFRLSTRVFSPLLCLHVTSIVVCNCTISTILLCLSHRESSHEFLYICTGYSVLLHWFVRFVINSCTPAPICSLFYRFVPFCTALCNFEPIVALLHLYLHFCNDLYFFCTHLYAFVFICTWCARVHFFTNRCAFWHRYAPICASQYRSEPPLDKYVYFGT